MKSGKIVWNHNNNNSNNNASPEVPKRPQKPAAAQPQKPVQEAKKANPDMDNSEIKKKSQQALTKARQEVGSVARRDRNIDITDKEWEAIQAGAVSASTLNKILSNTDADKLRQRAMPRTTNKLSNAQVNRIKNLSNSNYTIAEIANKLGVSTSTVSEYLKGVN